MIFIIVNMIVSVWVTGRLAVGLPPVGYGVYSILIINDAEERGSYSKQIPSLLNNFKKTNVPI